jgi:GDP-mannose 6-dehydrogenase
MKVSVFGLGYVGCVTAACLAQDGHQVMGVDVNQDKVGQIKGGISPISEPGLDNLIVKMVKAGRLQATTQAEEAIQHCDVCLVCVGTPSTPKGSIQLSYIERVCSEIGQALRNLDEYRVIVFRSTVLPHTVEQCLIPILEAESGRMAGEDFGVCMNPEFLREGSAIKDFYHPGVVIIGELDRRSGDVLEDMYASVDAPFVRTSLGVAEASKYASNCFHAAKITFANEIGNFCKINGIDGQEVMRILCTDTHLNISPSYLNPGFAFGGSCLPKDLRAIIYRGKELDLALPMLRALLESNRHQVERAIEMIESTGGRTVTVLGLSFKQSTDDVRESPTITLVETLVGRGFRVVIYDEHVVPSQLYGANRAYLERELPHVASLMCSSLEAAVEEADVVVIANASDSFRGVPQMLRPNQVLIDLIGIAKNHPELRGAYEGICW